MVMIHKIHLNINIMNEYKYNEDGNLTFDYNGETYIVDRDDE